ncbi:MAG: hypothetical protein Q8P06_01515 [Candidatus Azambacteria bacterium]|nr:hypothetical protein [Candidatus Azambacteria bacterium]
MIENFEIIRARTKDDVAILIDRLLKSKQNKVVLILPKNSILAVDPKALGILKGEAESVDKELFISTENEELEAIAEKNRIPIYNPDLDKKPEIKRMLDIVPPSQEVEEPESEITPELDFIPQSDPVIYEAVNDITPNEDLLGEDSLLEKNLEDFYKEPVNKPAPKKIASFKNLTLSFVGMSLLLLIAALYLILPRANIRISLKTIPVKANIPVAVSKSVNSSNFASGIIPGQYFLLTKSGSKTIEKLSETSNIPLKTGGEIYIYNAYSATSQKLVAQTRFETKDGKIFRIQKPIVIPGAKMSGTKLTPSSIKAEVISDSAGEEYQVGPSYFTIPGFKGSPKYAGFYAESSESMSPVQDNSTIATQEIEATKNYLKGELADALKNDVLSAVENSDLKLIEGAAAVSIDEFRVIGQTATMKISWQAIFFKEKDFRTLVGYFIANKYTDLKNFDFKDKITYPQVTRSDFKKGEMFFTFNLDKDNIFVADTAELKRELAGLNEDGMRNIISDKNFVNSATISLWPFWVKQAPNNPSKVNIILDK